MTVHMIFGGYAASKNRHDQKLNARWVLAIRAIETITDPRYLPSSDQPITVTRAVQWTKIPYSRCFLLILDTTI